MTSHVRSALRTLDENLYVESKRCRKTNVNCNLISLEIHLEIEKDVF